MASRKKAHKILAALELRARDTYSDIAARLDVSEQLVQYHVEKAEREKIILSYTTIIDLRLINRTFHLLYIRFFGLSTKTERNWLMKLNEMPGISVVVRTVGRWNVCIGVVAERPEHLTQMVSKACADVEGKIAEMLISTEIECTYSSLQILHRHKPVILQTRATENPVLIDEVDENILKVLSARCRTPATVIANKLGISSSTVQRRIARLEESGVIIGYKAQIDYDRLGYPQYRLLFKLTDSSPKVIAGLKKETLASGIVQSTSRYLGMGDLDLRCNTRSLDELTNFIDTLRDKFADEIAQIDIVPLFYWKQIDYLP